MTQRISKAISKSKSRMKPRNKDLGDSRNLAVEIFYKSASYSVPNVRYLYATKTSDLNWLSTFYGMRKASIGQDVRENETSLSGSAEKIINEKELGLEAIRKFERYARKIISAQGIKLVSVKIRDWISIEDPAWKQLIIEFTIEAQLKVALALWGNLSNELRDFLDSQYKDSGTALHEYLSVSFRW